MWFSLLAQSILAFAADPANVTVDPPQVDLKGGGQVFQLLVSGQQDGEQRDLTPTATYKVVSGDACSVSSGGLVAGVKDGQSVVEVSIGGSTVKVAVSVKDAAVRPPFNFERDIVPIFSRYGCNASACHAKAEGQNGFKLSVFGFDPKFDHATLARESRGRRTMTQIPEQSLLLLKAVGSVPHGGGARLKKDSIEYGLLRDWVAAGMPFGKDDDPQVKSIEVAPRERQLKFGATQQLRVIATYTDGRKADVTTLAKFQSNNDGLAAVDDRGFVTAGKKPGDVAIMASFMGSVDVFRTLVPQPVKGDGLQWPQSLNRVDELVDAKLKKLNITPSGLCSDSDYLRRVSLDIIGTLPTADEARAFLNDKRPNKRALLVESLLQRPEYADYWALKWSDLMRVDRATLGHRGAYLYYQWIRDSFAANKRMDQFVRELLTSEGPLVDAPAGHFFKAVTKNGERASTFSQALLGVRIECAQCHHHPFDRWGQDDYVGMEAFFVQASVKKTPRGEMLFATPTAGPSKHPRTGAAIHAYALGEKMGEASPEGDRRVALADWVTSKDNAFFARNVANRLWAYFTGRGLVVPVDDMRLTNPPSNPELLDELARTFVASGFDMHALIKHITASRTYQLATTSNPTNVIDEQNYSRALIRSLEAEVVFDAICQTTGMPEKFDGVPAGSRAIQLWDSLVPHYFLRTFGRPVRATACECERVAEPSVAQVLHVMNSPELQNKLAHEGSRITKLATSNLSDEALTDEFYLSFYSRYPTAAEKTATLSYLKNHNGQRRRAAEDIAWSLMNTTEFLFNH